MILRKLSIINYRNIKQAELNFSPKINCFIGANGEGKTNFLDAIYYLSFCKSSINSVDSQVIKHEEEFFMLQGDYLRDDQEDEVVYCGLRRKQKKHFKRNKKEYKRFSDHIGVIPLVMISPSDTSLILGASVERRNFVDKVISQLQPNYLTSLIRYNKALIQRNALLKNSIQMTHETSLLYEEIMGQEGDFIKKKRKQFIADFLPIFQNYYELISGGKELVDISYISYDDTMPLRDLLIESRQKDVFLGYSSKGIHRDDFDFLLSGFPIKKEGSQGQTKTFLIALKLAQYVFLKMGNNSKEPILLLDDLFDKLDAKRVENFISLVQKDTFGQLFVSDTNREHLDQIIKSMNCDYKIFTIQEGIIKE